MRKHYILLLFFVTALSQAQTRDVTFSVDMSGFSDSFTTVYVSGTFNSWGATDNALTDMGSGIWEVTIPLADGTYEYKFQVDAWTHQEMLTAGSVCSITNGGFQNRFLDVNGSNVSIETAPFSGCVEDASNPGPHDITFTVDMNSFGGSFTTVYVSGSFNGWSGTSNTLTDQGGGIWSGTISLPEGFHEFKFTLDDWAEQESFTSGDFYTVTNGGFTNRFVQADEAKSYGYEWNNASVLSNRDEIVLSTSVYPNPTVDTWNISISDARITSVEVFNILGKRVLSQQNSTNEISIDATGLSSGIFLAKVITDRGSSSLKLIKN